MLFLRCTVPVGQTETEPVLAPARRGDGLVEPAEKDSVYRLRFVGIRDGRFHPVGQRARVRFSVAAICE